MISANLFTWPDFFLCQSKSNGARAQDVVKLTGEFLKKTSKIVADSYNFLCLKTQLYISKAHFTDREKFSRLGDFLPMWRKIHQIFIHPK